VAGVTGSAIPPLHELPPVLVGVAGRAALEVGDPRQKVAAVAALAGGLLVATAQGVAGTLMVEGLVRGGLPTRGLVAALAAVAQPAGVGVAVAVATPAGCDAAVADARHAGIARRLGRVASLAGNPDVGPRQRVATRSVIEAVGRLPALLAVALGAPALLELSAVEISVATQAGRSQAHVGAEEILLLSAEQVRSADQLRLVAATAGESDVGPLEDEAGLAMIEGLGPPLTPEDELEPLAVVLDVAALTRSIVTPGVKAFPGVDLLAQERVALQAAGRIDSLAGRVAVEAVAGAFEIGVGAGEPSRGELGR